MITRDYSEGIEHDEITEADIGLAMLLPVKSMNKILKD